MLGNIHSSTASSTKKPVWNTLHWNPGLCDKKPALDHGTLIVLEVLLILGIFNKKQRKHQLSHYYITCGMHYSSQELKQ
jgi:hypothetical protein